MSTDSNDSHSWRTLQSNVRLRQYTQSGLSPCTTYYFRVAALGDGSTYAAEWGAYSQRDHDETGQYVHRTMMGKLYEL